MNLDDQKIKSCPNTVFENHPKCRIWICEFGIFHQFLSFLVTLFDQKIDNFWYFWSAFVHPKSKRNSLRSQCWMRLFLWFSDTVPQCDKSRFYLAKLTHPTIVRLQKNYEHLFKGALKMTLQKDFWIVTQGPFEEDVLEQIYQFHNLYLRGWMERTTWFAVKL